MKSVSRIFTDICNHKYAQLGFIQKRTTFIRIKGDIVQSFSLKKSCYVPSCTIEFGVCPLCHHLPIYFDGGPFDLEHFVVRAHPLETVWMYDPKDETSIYACLEDMIASFDACVIPLFEQSIDCSTTLRALALLEERRNEVRERERLIFGQDIPVGELDRKLFDSRYYYLSLKAKDVSFAKRFLQHWISLTEQDIAMCDVPPYNKMDGRKERTIESLRHYTEQLSQLENENWSYFEKRLANNESAMLTELSKNYPKLFK